MDLCERFLIAAGTAYYDRLPEEQQLPSVRDDTTRIIGWFTTRGYRHVLPHLTENPTAADLRSEIGKWFTDATRTQRDRVVVYYSGHGEVVGGDGHYLCARDVEYGPLGLLAHTAYPDEAIANAIAASSVQHALIIFDTCFASAGLRSLSQKAAAVLTGRHWDMTLPHGIHLIAAAREREIAKEGVFSEALCQVLDNRDFQLGGKTQQFLRPVAVVGAVNRYSGKGAFGSRQPTF